jgi:hypothetical protein
LVVFVVVHFAVVTNMTIIVLMHLKIIASHHPILFQRGKLRIDVTIQVHLPNETKVLLIRIAYLAERATRNLSVLYFLLDSTLLLCYPFWPWKKSWSYRGER